jgi:hypothetical protein
MNKFFGKVWDAVVVSLGYVMDVVCLAWFFRNDD